MESLRKMHPCNLKTQGKSILINVFFFQEIHFEPFFPVLVSSPPLSLSISFKCLKKPFRLTEICETLLKPYIPITEQ